MAQDRVKHVEPRKPVVTTAGINADLAKYLEPVKQTLEMLTGRRSGVREIKGLSQTTPLPAVVDKVNELAARLNGSGTVEIGKDYKKEPLEGDYAPAIHTHVKADITDFPNLAMVAYSGSYEDLHDTPTIPDPVTVDAALSSTSTNPVQNKVINTALAGKAAASHTHVAGDVSGLATVATSGSYNDLSDKPTIPVVPTNVSAFTNDAGYLTQHQDISGKANTADLSTVAFSGSYNDLSNKPTIPTVPTNVSAFTNDAGYLTQHQDLSDYVQASDLSAVAISGSYNDLTDTPDIVTTPGPQAGGNGVSDIWSSGHTIYVNKTSFSYSGHTHPQYLQLSGGTMTGPIVKECSNTTPLCLARGEATGQSGYSGMFICGGTESTPGGTVTVHSTGNVELSYNSGGATTTAVLDLNGFSVQGHYVATVDQLAGYLPLAGGEMEGNIVLTPYYDASLTGGGQVTLITKGKNAKGTAPSATEWHTYAMAVDSTGGTDNSVKYGQIETAVKSTGEVETYIAAFKPISGNTTSHKIIVGSDASGNAYTSAPTPPAGDNSTQIATTAWVNTKAGSYLPLAGGTMTGTIVSSAGGVIKSGSATGYVSFFGGVDAAATSGGKIYAYGVSHSSSPGQVMLQAGDANGYKQLILKPDGTFTWGGTAVSLSGHTHSYLPLSGGTVTGNVNYKYGITKWTATPSSTQYQGPVRFFDSEGTRGFALEVAHYTNSKTLLKLQVDKGAFGGSGTSSVAIGYDRTAGTVYTEAPTPPASDNSTQIATTAWVTTKVGSYLLLAGGTMSGAITRNGVLAKATSGGNSLILQNGDNNFDGASLQMFGRSHSSYAGRFYLRASSKSASGASGDSADLIGRPEGALTWDGRQLSIGRGTYSNLKIKTFGYITASGTALDLVFPVFVGKGVGKITFTAITGTIRQSNGGYLTPGSSGSDNILSGATQGTWYNLNDQTTSFRLVRSGGWGSSTPNNGLVVADLTCSFTAADS